MPYGKPCPQAPSNTGRITTRVTYAKIAKLKAIGTWYCMPSFRQISTSRNAHDTKAPMAQTVMICHSPPCNSGAMPKP